MALGFAQGNTPSLENHRVCMAVFTPRQLFWPELEKAPLPVNHPKPRPARARTL